MLRRFLRTNSICASLIRRLWQRLLKNEAKKGSRDPSTGIEQYRSGETKPNGVMTPSRHPTSYHHLCETLNAFECHFDNFVGRLDPRDCQLRCAFTPSIAILLFSNFTLFACGGETLNVKHVYLIPLCVSPGGYADQQWG